MKHLILVTTLFMSLALGFSGSALAGELDNEGSVINQNAMNGAVVVRVDTRDNSAAIMSSASPLASDAQAKALVKTGAFEKVPAANVRSELDQDAGSSSWYFYNGYNNGYNNPYYNYSYSSMYWYGSWYSPCYSYNYSYYQYYYYSNYRW